MTFLIDAKFANGFKCFLTARLNWLIGVLD